MIRQRALGAIGRRSAAALVAAVALAGCLPGEPTTPGASNDDITNSVSPTNVASLTEVVTRNPRDPQAYNMRGSVLGQAGRYQEALADFNTAISLDPGFAQAFANRGLVNRQSGRFDQALADYNRAIAIDAGYAVA